ncbi:phytoene desaturase [Laceyella sacchari]|uniref:phytoene desaturase family protein n=1 Tax=Laceyella tengchongensis TaxID=574699 RepID=UPI000C9F0AD2|nr:phytoene desaturase [Laceyella sacchari]MRG27279.1 NAD(P)-binding protein [Laceyella tengchongensis]
MVAKMEERAISAMKKAIIIGGGLAGLVTAIKLATMDFKVSLFEKESKVGGSCRAIQLEGGYQFDLEPAPMMMPWVFERIFREAGSVVDPSLRFIPLPVNSRHFFYNKSIVDLTADGEAMADQLTGFSPENRTGFLDYLYAAQTIYEWVEETLLASPTVGWTDLLRPGAVKSTWKMKLLQPLDAFHRRFFDDARMLAMMNRYATYVGSSPYKAPAVVAMFAYLELVQGVSYVEGGNERLIEALVRLAQSRGVELHTGCAVDEILLSDRKVTGVDAGGEKWEADVVVSCIDPIQTRVSLLKDERYAPDMRQLSCSQVVGLLGCKETYPVLHYHNYFYPREIERYYIDLFEQREWPDAPLIYVGNPCLYEADRTGSGCSLCVTVQVPASFGLKPGQFELYRERLLYLLERVWGLQGLSEQIEVEQWLGPLDLQEMTGAYGGALNGRVFHGFRAAIRQPLKDRKRQGLYYAGAGAYPGGDQAMAAISGLHTAHLIKLEEERKESKLTRLG